MDWQPIKTAPKDGTTIYGQNWQTAERGLVHLNIDGKWQIVNGLTNLPRKEFFEPTHWMPMPPSPPPQWPD